MSTRNDEARSGEAVEIPYASRPFGWCQTYKDTGPRHEKCDGKITGVKKPCRCPCSCHRRRRRVVRVKR